MALGAGVLVSRVALELVDEVYRVGGLDAAAVGLLLGAAVFSLADREIDRRGGGRRKNSGDEQEGSATAIAFGALLDGVPDSVATGISPTWGNGGGVTTVGFLLVFALSRVGQERPGQAVLRLGLFPFGPEGRQ